MRIYTVDTLDFWRTTPRTPQHLRQAAPTRTSTSTPASARSSTFSSTTELEPAEDIRIVVWPETASVGQRLPGGQMAWPFPQAGSAETEYPRDFSFSLPLYDGEWSAWLEDARPAAVLTSSDEQLQATYQVLCGDTSGLYPVDEPPTTDQPFPQVRTDAGALPIFGAGAGPSRCCLRPRRPPVSQRQVGHCHEGGR
jgi:hypothetical protein